MATAANEHRHNVDVASFLKASCLVEQLVKLGSAWVDPLADVLDFDGDQKRLTGSALLVKGLEERGVVKGTTFDCVAQKRSNVAAFGANHAVSVRAARKREA
jgi:hypothetical protein